MSGQRPCCTTSINSLVVREGNFSKFSVTSAANRVNCGTSLFFYRNTSLVYPGTKLEKQGLQPSRSTTIVSTRTENRLGNSRLDRLRPENSKVENIFQNVPNGVEKYYWVTNNAKLRKPGTFTPFQQFYSPSQLAPK